MKKQPSPKLRSIIKKLKNLNSNDPSQIEVLEKEVANYWLEQGFNVDIVEMALTYARNRAQARLEPFSEDIKQKGYPTALSTEIEKANNWLYSLRKLIHPRSL